MVLSYFSKKDIDFLFTGFTISKLLYNFLIEVAPKVGIKRQDLQQYLNFESKIVTSDKRVSLIKAYKLWLAIEKASNRSDIGFLVADHFTLDKAGIVGDLFLGTKNLKESVDIISRFLSLMIDNISLRYYEIGNESVFYFDIVPRFLMPLSIVECYIKICYNWVKQYTQLNNLPIVEIHYYGKKPKHVDYYTNNFPKATTIFGENENYIILKKDIFYMENKNKQSKPYKHILKYAKDMKQNIFLKSSLSHKIINQILISMPSKKHTLSDISKNLNISASTIKRKLKQENTSFNKLTDMARKDLAGSMIKDKTISYEEISFLLGYSQYSPFFRAFKKWFHDSPSNYRKKLINSSF